MGDISSYGVRSSVAGTDRIFVATADSPELESCTLAQVAGLGGGGSSESGPIVGVGGLSRPALSSLTLISVGPDATITETAGGPISIQVLGAANGIHALGVTPPASGDWSYKMLVELLPAKQGWMGAYVEDAAENGLAILYNQNGYIYLQQVSARTSSVGNLGQQDWPAPAQFLWIRVSYTAATNTITFDFSSNGLVWDGYFSTTLSGVFTGIPTFIGANLSNFQPRPSWTQHLWAFGAA